ncbi:MAG: thioredoxin family protein [Planctomycetes bacterium]|nr:thioredoxin family protein [Planctomycetota bacterium]
MTRSQCLFLSLALLVSMTAALADEKNRREQAVRNDQNVLSDDARWLYNDLDSGFDAAKKPNKPLLFVLRCVPCKARTGIDQSVLRAKELQPLLDGFVCVRLINANAIDLSKFQFDYDLSFSTLVFHPQGTLIARFGSWQHQLDEMET